MVLSLSRLSRSTRDVAELVETTFSVTKGKRRAAALISLNEGFDTAPRPAGCWSPCSGPWRSWSVRSSASARASACAT